MNFNNLAGRNRYTPLDDLSFGDVLEALREATVSVCEVEDQERVQRLLERLSSAVDLVVVEKNEGGQRG